MTTLSLPDLLFVVSQSGIRLTMDDNRLRVSAPKGGVTPEIRESLVSHREVILKAISVRRADNSVIATKRDAVAWVERLDVDGQIGWEPPDLREEDRWWARWRFDDLPSINETPPEKAQRAQRCYWCGSKKFWKSVYGVVICGNCHPPAFLELAME